ncbi:hypothetical protein BS50DRAFT_485785 [Corynespora cassiicola Philippines]|uniref:RRM domain-containing protein n=1 Tax=Corynespora cassiicola Philippines TaxID=1448308 RepID=A0A2T2P114_CORCC|nr:hypothetical protein BS50DRAFT_485785 [Corynespora cassiicola Philippines]
MSHSQGIDLSSPISFGGQHPASSPYTGTDFTAYSPEQVRAGPSAAAPKAAPLGLAIAAPGPPIFLNDFSIHDAGYISRYLQVIALPDGSTAGSDQEYETHAVTQEMKKYAVYVEAVPVYNHGVHVRFDDISHATESKQQLEQTGFTVDYSDGHTFCIVKCQDTAANNEFEGQIRVVAKLRIDDGSTFKPDYAASLGNFIERDIGVFGVVRACIHVDTDESSKTFVFRMEFNSIDAANRAVASTLKDGLYGQCPEFTWSIIDARAWNGPMTSNSPHARHPRIDDQGRLVQFRLLPQPNLNLLRGAQHDQHNRVRRERIIDGTDVRTTIMLRNIPNKLDWMNLKTLLDKYCFGTYDFLYLRIDFRTGCNVGYAFINFNDVNGMISIIDNLEHRNWNGYRSSKAAEVSYATIQGKEALTTKFRNSSVMQETPFCRPRTFMAYSDAVANGTPRLAGTEVSFPIPDNLLKLQRSIESARSMGLYPPHGVNGLNDHRNRASAYDRGTPRDIMESTAMGYSQSNNLYGIAGSVGDPVKRLIEQWYVEAHGQCQLGVIPFAYIPTVYINQYLATHNGAPGVIGQPSHSARSVRTSVFANPAVMTTPSRASGRFSMAPGTGVGGPGLSHY